MKVSREQAAKNRAHVVEVAGAQFRRHGFDGIGVADLMQAAGLTHGGFYNNFASKDALAAEARTLAVRLAGLAPLALAQTKRALQRAWSVDLETALGEEAYRQGLAGATADHAEGLAAFVEKRPPRFTGSSSDLPDVF
jgi:TetR/AcrR family transcriptional repressor of nem operon